MDEDQEAVAADAEAMRELLLSLARSNDQGTRSGMQERNRLGGRQDL